jgi:hypothetical protein
MVSDAGRRDRRRRRHAAAADADATSLHFLEEVLHYLISSLDR